MDAVQELLEKLREILHPTTFRICFELSTGEKTVTELAKRLNLSPSTVQYHLEKLVKLGLVEIARTETRGNLLVKYYKLRDIDLMLKVSKDITSRDVKSELSNIIIQYIIPLILSMSTWIMKNRGTNAGGSFYLNLVGVDKETFREIQGELDKLCKRLREAEVHARRRDVAVLLGVTLLFRYEQ
jgi:DNA-binding MarR family transcriptional regulator